LETVGIYPLFKKRKQMSIKKDLKARGLFINRRKRTEMLSVSLAMVVGVGAVTIAAILFSSIL